ncbi:MAG TPA: fumarylacetoacetate hydrolase [Methylophaga aminisulfidivorans]|uniref:fumarylacetoacetate hydrolase family protein n=1 Tax=Methylophaga aminisulfidivorans TaxID=230105 RepID=UPI001A12FA49|nr:fumarylacetoacetate hydrolase family protein [Methylophaga aminisulfidivorans]HIM39949.1 fumarylacetoacetate hydrolase [Methylophaga aminisulfidivorans]
MKLATLKNGTRDGKLVVVSRDLTLAVEASDIALTMQYAIENWSEVEGPLTAIYTLLNNGECEHSFTFDPYQAMAPLPRCHQFIDASAFLNHGNIMEKAFNLDVKTDPNIPILIQRQSDDFRGPHEDYAFITEGDNADFEGEFAVITDDIPLGTSAENIESHIKLVTILNDMSMRKHLFRELQMGFGFILAKPATVFAPVAVTPDELGDAWKDGRIHLDMQVSRNGEWFGHPSGGEMDFTFGQILGHIAYNRSIKAGMILGSGTVSNKGWKDVGSACLAERRALDILEFGEVKTDFLKFGETLQFDVQDAEGQSVFGRIDHKMVKA